MTASSIPFPTMTTKPVYLPHHMIPVQLQTEVRKCLDTWLRQGIICPSRSPYVSQVVIMHKKTGEIHLCINFRALNAITIHGLFPLYLGLRKLCRLLSLPCGLPQLIWHKDTFNWQWMRLTSIKQHSGAGLSGLYEFTHMPFGLSNVGASFCHLMEMCLGDQQYLTLLFYLNDICIFSSYVDKMLNRIEMVLKCLQDFNLKIKPKKSFFFQSKVLFLGHILSKEGISPNPENVQKVKDWPVPSNVKEVHSFLGLASYYHWFVLQFVKWAKSIT